MSKRLPTSLLIAAFSTSLAVSMGGCDSPLGLGGGTDAGTPDQAMATQVPPDSGPPAETYQVQFGPVNVDPGVEKTECVVKRLGNTHDIHVGTIHNQLGT